MNEYEAMMKYGDDEGYISCFNCPCFNDFSCSGLDTGVIELCDGRTAAYKAITAYFDGEQSTDMVNHPPHYTQDGIECIDEMIMVFGEETVMDFCLCNVWKYRKRALHKNGQEDLDKANWYMKKYKELLENGK